MVEQPAGREPGNGAPLAPLEGARERELHEVLVEAVVPGEG